MGEEVHLGFGLAWEEEEEEFFNHCKELETPVGTQWSPSPLVAYDIHESPSGFTLHRNVRLNLPSALVSEVW